MAIGAMLGIAGIPFWPVWLAGAAGAALGDWLSYEAGLHFKARIANNWPLSRHPDLLPRGHAFMEKWGVAGVFIGRFFGPLRAVVPLIAGLTEMPRQPFQIANVSSAIVWAWVLLAIGDLGFGSLARLFGA